MGLQTDQRFLIRGSLVNGLGVVIRAVSPLIVILVARVFGKEVFGLYVSVQLWILTVSRVLVLGLDKGLTWFIPRNPHEGRAAGDGVIESFWWTTGFALLFVLATAALLQMGFLDLFPGLSGLSASEVLLYTISLIPLMGLHVFAGAAEGQRMPQYRILINQFLVTAAAPLCAVGMHLYLHVPNALAWGLVVGNTLGLVVYALVSGRMFPGLQWRKFGFPAKPLLAYSLPLGASEVISSLLMRVDLWMVLSLLGPSEAGVYAIMVTIANALRTIRQSFDPLITPVVAGLDQTRIHKELPELYSYGVNMVSTIQLCIGLFILFLPGEVLAIAGKGYVFQPWALGILLLGNLLNGYLGLSGSVLLGLGQSVWILRTNVAALSLNLGLNAWLIPHYGIAGAALASVSSTLLQNMSLNVLLLKQGLWLYRPYTGLQAIWIVLFALLLFLFPHYAHMSLSVRAGLLSSLLLMVGAGIWFHKEHYLFRRASEPDGSQG